MFGNNKVLKKYLKYFVGLGFLVGFLDGVRILIFTYIEVPSVPGIYEVLVQLGIILFLALLYSFYAFLGWSLLFLSVKVYQRAIKIQS